MKAAAVAVVLILLTGQPASAGMIADWQMNEGRNARVMHDRTGHHNAWIKARVTPGGGVFRFKGRRSYLTYDPKRVITVPESDRLDPMNSIYTVQVRFKAERQFDPNIVQKGQTKQTGGFFKIGLFRGQHPRCLFRDETGLSRAIGMRGLNVADGRWTTLRCKSGTTTTRLTVWHRGRKYTAVNNYVGRIGTINNTRPLVIGGKVDCAAADVGCDYFKGQIDYVKIRKG